MTDDTRPNGPTEDAPTEAADTVSGPTSLPDHIGRYRILGKLGEGGMGVVYEAEQQEPRRRVALKVVRGGQFVDEARVRMFQREAESLARLKHANIGAIYESGRTEDGQHFFAMELVRGDTLDAYIDRRPTPITTKELEHRLRLFRQICDAVHYAHQRGVIHRDLKPSNIVVTEETSRGIPEIKILDFGLARITEGDLAAATLTTEIGVIKGTLPYMSPEQARGRPDEIDVRTDVYALGVVLYELLAGERPYDVARAALVEAVRIICDEPPAPLQRTPSGVRKLDADVETIVGKALEKDPDRRYASAAGLSEDIERYLTSQPILARAPSAVYQLRRFAGRNRALVGGVAATFVVLVAGVVVATVLGLREASQRREAEQARDDLEAVVDFQAGMLSEVDPALMGRRLMSDLGERVSEAHRRSGSGDDEVEAAIATLRAVTRGVNATDMARRLVDENVLDQAVQSIETGFAEQPLIEAKLRHTVANTSLELGLHDRAETEAELAAQIYRRELGEDHADTVRSAATLGGVYLNQGRHADAEPLMVSIVQTQRRTLGADHPDTLASSHNLAGLHRVAGRYDAAEKLLLDVVKRRRRILGEQHLHTVMSLNNLANVYLDLGRYPEAEALLLEALETKRRVLGEQHPSTIEATNNLAVAYLQQDRYDEAEPLLLESLDARRSVLGDDHPDTLRSASNLPRLYVYQERLDEAEPLLLATLQDHNRVLGRDHPLSLGVGNTLGMLYRQAGRYEEAEQLSLEALESQRRVLGNDHGNTLGTLNNLAYLYRSMGRYDESEQLYLEAVESLSRVMGDDHPSTRRSLYYLADLYRATGKLEQARPYLERVLAAQANAAVRVDATPLDKNQYARLLLTLEPADLRDPETALSVALELNNVTGSVDPRYLDTLALAYRLTGDMEQAIEIQRKALALAPEDRPDMRATLERRLAELEAAAQEP